MKITKILCIPGQGVKKLIMYLDGKEFGYTNLGPGTETLHIGYFGVEYRKHKLLGGASRPTTSRSYLLWQEEPPKKYADVLVFLREEYTKIDWEALEVRNALTGEYCEELEA